MAVFAQPLPRQGRYTRQNPCMFAFRKIRPFSMYRLLFLLFCSSLLGACASLKPASPSGMAFFHPGPKQLKEGIVNKYYYHFKSDNGHVHTTDIQYRLYRQTDLQTLSVLLLNSALEPNQRIQFGIDGAEMLVREECRFFRGDTVRSAISRPGHSHWAGGTAVYASTTRYSNGYTQAVQAERKFLKDSVIWNRPARIFIVQRQLSGTREGQEPDTSAETIREIYVAGIGLFSAEGTVPDGRIRLELVEQIPAAGLEQRRQQVPKRVAWIDPVTAIDARSTFRPCQPEDEIIDYYNGEPNAGFPGGKQALRTAVLQRLDPLLLGQASGYLTFRFVVNCAGEAGWFVTEQADLDFRPTTFPPQTIGHLYNILSGIGPWQACVWRGKAVDAYFYVTFKLQDGELIEMLP